MNRLHALPLVLGPATLVVESGGQWTDPDTGEVQNKLHLYWRLKPPATGDDLNRVDPCGSSCRALSFCSMRRICARTRARCSDDVSSAMTAPSRYFPDGLLTRLYF